MKVVEIDLPSGKRWERVATVGELLDDQAAWRKVSDLRQRLQTALRASDQAKASRLKQQRWLALTAARERQRYAQQQTREVR